MRASTQIGIALALLLVLAPPARACSCVPSGSHRAAAERALRESDLVFVGILRSVRAIERTADPSGRPRKAFFRYRVTRAYGGRPGRFVRVRSHRDVISCGLPRRMGQRFAIAARRSPHDAALEAGLCSLLSPRAVRRAARDADPSRRVGTSARARCLSSQRATL